MKRVAAFLFLSVMLSSLVGVYAYFAVRLQQIHREMRIQLKQRDLSELTRLQLTLDELAHSLVEDDEMEWHGRMFDIAKVDVQTDGRVDVYGVYDDDEDSLLSFLDAVLRNALNDEESVPPNFGELEEFTTSEATAIPHSVFFITTNKTAYHFPVSESFRTILLPPPRS